MKNKKKIKQKSNNQVRETSLPFDKTNEKIVETREIAMMNDDY